MGIDIPRPFDLPDAARPFADDAEHATYDPVQANRYWQVLSQVTLVLEEFAAGFSGKASPVHHFWHTFDVPYTRFSDRRVDHPAEVDPVTREAYSREVISFGFWFGDDTFLQPAFYSYAAPEPAGLAAEPLRPASARWVARGDSHLAVLRLPRLRGLPGEPGRRRRGPRPPVHAAVGPVRAAARGRRDRRLSRAGRVEEERPVRHQRLRRDRPGAGPGLVPGAADGGGLPGGEQQLRHPVQPQDHRNPSQGKGGSCNGDSGGPVFFKGTRVIAAVVSFGMNPQCNGLDFSYRLDRPEVLAWILDPNRVDAG